MTPIQHGLSKEQEYLFFLDQVFEKAIIRFIENRMLPIDNLVLCIWGSSPSQFNFRPLTLNTKLGKSTQLPSGKAIENPFLFLSTISEHQLQEMISEHINPILEAISYLYLSNKKLQNDELLLHVTSLDYWNSIEIVSKYFISKKSSTLEHSVIHPSVIGDVRELFKQVVSSSDSLNLKDQISKLGSLQKDVKSKLYIFDPTFWDSILNELSVFRAKILLFSQFKFFNKSREHLMPSLNTTKKEPSENFDNLLNSLLEDDHPDAIRQQVSYSSSKPDEAEESYGAVPVLNFNIDDPSRKYIPRYFSRVFSGFDWNRYNQTHYDQSNPPPKYVQGYKFVVFYPRLNELSTLSQVPSYDLCNSTGNEVLSELEPHMFPSTKPTEIITFSAPPPYVVSF